MINLMKPMTFHDLADFSHSELLQKIKDYCRRGDSMHPDSLKAVVIKLVYMSRDLELKQDERDSSAELANDLARVAVRAYGKNSEYCLELLHQVRAITGGAV